MPSIDIPAASADITVNTTAAGIVTVASTTAFYPGAEAWLSGAALTSVRVLILKILSATTMQCRALLEAGSNVNTLSYGGGSDLSAFTAAAPSRIDMPGQAVRIDRAFSKHDVQ